MSFEQEAYAIGAGHAKSAASWIVDGNTKVEVIPAVLAMIDAGDPAADGYLPRRPDLSGEWADDMTPLALAVQVTGFDAAHLNDEDVNTIADAYERGVSDTFEPECERILRAAVV